MITVANLNKYYTDKHVLRDISFSVAPGTIFGLMGPNGAGKTTLIRTMTRLIYHDSGEIRFGGEVMEDRHRPLIGYMPEERGLYTSMRVDDHLDYFIDLYALDRKAARALADDLIDRLGLAGARERRVKELSKGMSQKVQFIITIIHNPRLLILDEPFSGLDPASTEVMIAVLRDIIDQYGTTVILSTHRMEQLENLCDAVLLINGGRVVAQGSVEELRKAYSKNVVRVDFIGPRPHLPQFPELALTDSGLRISGRDSAYSNAVLKALIAQGVTVERFEHTYPSLREIFLTEVNATNNEQDHHHRQAGVLQPAA